MIVKRPGIVTILAILAGVATIITGYKLLIQLGIVPPTLGALYFFGINSLGALATGVKLVVFAAATYGLWTMKPWGWLLTVIVAIYGLCLGLLELLSQSALTPVLGSALIDVLVLLSVLSPRARNSFAAAEQARAAK